MARSFLVGWTPAAESHFTESYHGYIVGSIVYVFKLD